MVRRTTPTRFKPTLQRTAVVRPQARITSATVSQASTQSLTQEAERLDEVFKTTQFASVENFQEEYNKIPEAIRKKMNITSDYANTLKNNLIKQIRTLKRESYAKQKQYNDREKEAKTESQADSYYLKERLEVGRQQGYMLAEKQILAGNLYNISDVKNFAFEKGKELRNTKRISLEAGKLRELAQTQAQAKTQVVTTAPKTFSVNQEVIRTPMIRDLKTGKVIQESTTKVIQATTSKVGKDQQTQAKVQINDIKTGKTTIKTYQNGKLINTQTKSFFKTEPDLALKSYGLTFLTKAFDINQKKIILDKITATQRGKLLSIDVDKKLSTFEKEKQKREVLGLFDNFLDTPQFKISVMNKKVKDQFIKDMKKQTLSIENKVRTGQTVTPKEQTTYFKFLELKGKNITNQQKQNAIKIYSAVPNYINYLKLRKQSGEKNPFKNDALTFVKGLKRGAVDPFIDIGVGILKAGGNSVKASYNYGVRITKEAQKGKFVIDDDIKALAKVIGKKTKKFGEITFNVVGYVANNPIKSALIVGMVGNKIGASTYADFQKNPVGFTGEAIGFILSGRVGTTAVKGIKGLPTKLKNIEKYLFSIDELKDNKRIIKSLSSKKSLTREESNILKGLREQVKITQDLKFLTTAKGQIKSKIIKNISKPQVLNVKQSQILEQVIDRVKNKKIKPIRLSDKKKSELLGKLFKEKVVKVKVIKALSTTNEGLVKQLLEARKTSGEAFSKLKKKIKKEKGLNVVERKIKGETTYKLLEPKKQRVKGVKKVKKQAREFIVTKQGKIIEQRVTSQSIPIKVEPIIQKQSLRSLDKIEKQIQREIKLGNTRKKKWNKKGQAQFNVNVKRFYKNTSKQIKRLRVDTQDFINDYNKTLKKRRKILNIPKSRRSTFKDLTITERKKFKVKANKLSKQIKQATKTNNKIKLLSKSLLRLGTTMALSNSQLKGLNKASAISNISATALEKDLDKITKLESIFKQPIKKIIKPTPKPKKKISIKRVVKKPTIKKILKKVLPKRKPIPTKRITQPKKVTKIPPRLKLKLKDETMLNKQGKRLSFNAEFREKRNKSLPYDAKKNPRVRKVINIGEPFKKALDKITKGIDNSNAQRLKLVIAGVTSKKDLRVIPSRLKKFKLSKNKDGRSYTLIEKKKNLIDTKGEKLGLSLAKALKKKAKIVKTKKKASPKTKPKVSKIKKIKKSSKTKPKKIYKKKGKKK